MGDIRSRATSCMGKHITKPIPASPAKTGNNRTNERSSIKSLLISIRGCVGMDSRDINRVIPRTYQGCNEGSRETDYVKNNL